jgi:hypothetical protein
MRARPSCKETQGDPSDEAGFLRGTLLWSVLSAFLLVHFLGSDLVGLLLQACKGAPVHLIGPLSICREYVDPVNHFVATRHGLAAHMAVATVPGALAFACAWLLARRWAIGWPDFAAWTLSGAIYGACVAVGFTYAIIPDQGSGTCRRISCT